MEETLYSATNKQNAAVSRGPGRENGNSQEGVLLKAFSRRQPRLHGHD